MSEPQATFLFLKVSGDEAVKSASEVLAKLIGSIAAEPAAPASPAVELAPPEPRLNIAQVPYEKPADEPDGFALPNPKPAKAVGVGCGGRSEATSFNRFKGKSKKTTKPPANRPPGVLASRIMRILDLGSGVAPLEVLVNETGSSAQACNMAITKCAQLKRLDDGRIALEGYSDTD
jgi:hypothetical protein